MNLSTFTFMHVVLSLIGIATGAVVIAGFLGGFPLRRWNVSFLVFTIATTVTGFLFPFHGMTPAIVLGIVSSVVLVGCLAGWNLHWTRTYILCAIAAEYLNTFVLVVQLFQKVPLLHTYAPRGSEPIVGATQLLVLAAIITASVFSLRRSRQVSLP